MVVLHSVLNNILQRKREKSMKKTVKSILISGVMIVMAATPVFAGQWQSNAHGWWYQNDDDSYPVNGWKWIDGRCYYVLIRKGTALSTR